MKAKNKTRNRTVTIALSIAAIGLLAFGSVGGARAAITNYTDAYVAEFETQEIGVALTENGATLEEDAVLLQSMIPAGEKLKVGVKYDEAIGATNTGAIEEYVRITEHKYWIGADGKRVDLSPNLIELTFNEDDWILVDENQEDETVTLYYRTPVAVGDSTEDAVTGLKIDGKLATWVTQKTSGNTITTEYKYNGVSVGLDADVDSVQTHNAEDAILSAWGVNAVGADSGTITAIN